MALLLSGINELSRIETATVGQPRRCGGMRRIETEHVVEKADIRTRSERVACHHGVNETKI